MFGRGRLRTQLFFSAVILIGLGLVGITGYLIHLNTRFLGDFSKQQTDQLLQAATDKATLLARNGALGATTSVVLEDYDFLQGVVDKTVAADKQVLYGFIANARGKAVVHSESGKRNKVVGPKVGAKPSEVSAERLTEGGKSLLQAQAPIMVGQGQWGTVVYGLSLASVDEAIVASKKQLKAAVQETVIVAGGIGLILMLIGIVITAISAYRVVRPVSHLEAVIQKALAGQKDVRAEVSGSGEVSSLAENFNGMLETLAQRDSLLHRDLLRMELAVAQAKEVDETKGGLVSRVPKRMLQPIERILKDQEALITDFRSLPDVTVFACPSCRAEFEPEGAEAEHETMPCPDCGATMQRSEGEANTGDPDEQRRHLAAIETTGSELLELVNSILDFSKAEANRAAFTAEPLAVDELLRKTKDAVVDLAGDKSILWPAVEAGLAVAGDRARVEQGFAMAVELVCSLTRERQVKVELEPTTIRGVAGVQLAVRDDGPGLTREHVEALKTGDAPEIRACMNLVVLRRIAELHEGQFQFDSAVGHGIVAHLSLPRANPAEGNRAAVGAS